MFYTNCPYCNNYNKHNFTFRYVSNSRDITCEKCGLTYNADFRVQSQTSSYDEELKKVLRQDFIDTVKKVITKYLGYEGKGGYENTRNITLDNKWEERISNYDNALVISFSGRARYYGTDYRTVRFFITYDSIWPQVTSEYKWVQSHWFVGATLEEKVDNYIQKCLIKWETI
jgi:transcription elongation factor Elf1